MTVAQFKRLATNYAHLNTQNRVSAACKEHNAFRPSQFNSIDGMFVVNTEDIVFDYTGMSHQPRIGTTDPGVVKRYVTQALEGVDGIFGIRKPITVYWSASQKKFLGIMGHHRFKAATEIGYECMVVKIDDSFINNSKSEQIDKLMSDNAFADNGFQSCMRSVTEALRATLQDDSFMQEERTKQAQLQKKLENCKENSRREDYEKQIKELDKKIRARLEPMAQKWNPSATKKTNKTLVTKAMNNHKAKHLVQLFNHSKQQRKDFIASDVASLGQDDLYFDWGQGVTNNNVQINLPTAEFLGRVREYKKANEGRLPSSFTFYTCIPGGVKDYQHLFNLRRRIEADILDRVADVYTAVPRKFKFLGQVLNNNSQWVENHKKLYSSTYISSYFTK